MKVDLGGWPGAPGVNQWFFTSGQTEVSISAGLAGNEVHSFYDTLKGNLVNGMTWSVESEVKVFDIATGNLEDVLFVDNTGWSGSSTASLTTGDMSRATMAKLQFYTNTVNRNRLIQGGIYFGPINNLATDTDGSLQNGFRSNVQNACQAMISGAGPRLQVWSRPNPQKGYVGLCGDVTGVNTMRVPAVLRSRRD